VSYQVVTPIIAILCCPHVVPVDHLTFRHKAIKMVAKKDLTDRRLKALKAAQPGRRRIVWDAAVPGMGIRVTDKAPPDRKGSFVLVARYPGSKNPAPRRLGDYPAMSLATARERARQWRELLRRGIDPSAAEERQRREEELRQTDTFRAAWSEYKAEHLDKLRTGKNIDATIRRLAMPRFGRMPLTDIRARDGRELIREVAKDAPIEANRLRSYLHHFFGWCVELEKIDDSPFASIRRPTKETKRDRVLTDVEIRAFWRACDRLGAFGRAFKLMLVVGQRRSEIGSLAWAEIDRRADVWRLPRERTKAAREHEVWLSPLAMEMRAARRLVKQRPRSIG
jgi:integrase